MVFGLPQWALDKINEANAAAASAPPPPTPTSEPSGQPVAYVPISGFAKYDGPNVDARNNSFEEFLSFLGLALSMKGVDLSFAKFQSPGNADYPVQPAYFMVSAVGADKAWAGAWSLYHYDMFQNFIEKALAFLYSSGRLK